MNIKISASIWPVSMKVAMKKKLLLKRIEKIVNKKEQILIKPLRMQLIYPVHLQIHQEKMILNKHSIA